MGPGFDALGLALAMYLEVRVAKGDALADGHPSQVAFTSAGGDGPISVRSQIPMGRGLGFSGAARVAGVLAALAQQQEPADVAALAEETLARSAVLEGHEDNVAASLYGGVVAVAGGRAVRVPLGIEPAIVVWVPTARTSTEESRGKLPTSVSLADASFNVGRTALLVAAIAAGDIGALRSATADRLHQDIRLAAAPESRRAMDAAVDAGAWCSWLSGSGPTIAAMASVDDARRVAAALPSTGQARVLGLDHEGAVIDRSA
jgi:homoserine kinase